MPGLSPILDWLFSEAGAGWVFGLVSAGALLASYIRRRRPALLLVREVYKTSLVRIRPDVRERIKIDFDGSPVKRLAEVELEVSNDGSEVIRAPRIEVVFSDVSRILEVSGYEGTDGVTPRVEVAGNRVAGDWPYLNARRDHGQRTRLAFLLDGEIDLTVRGSGEGWSVVHSPLPNTRREIRYSRALLTIATVFAVLAPVYQWWIGVRFGVGFWEVSKRSFLFALPPIGLFGVVGYLSLRRLRSIALRDLPTPSERMRLDGLSGSSITPRLPNER